MISPDNFVSNLLNFITLVKRVITSGRNKGIPGVLQLRIPSDAAGRRRFVTPPYFNQSAFKPVSGDPETFGGFVKPE